MIRPQVYWTVPGVLGSADGGIYWALADELNPTVHSLVSSIGQKHVVDPMGIAVHYDLEVLYWIDRNLTKKHTVLRSCAFDGSNYNQMFIFNRVDNHSVSVNVSDLVIDFSHNNTAFFADRVRHRP